jgi:hypothetical protein
LRGKLNEKSKRKAHTVSRGTWGRMMFWRKDRLKPLVSNLKKGKYHFELRTDGIFSRKKKVNRWYIGMKYKHKSNDIKDN